ncbi:MAG TPA: hypothetical protein VGW57_00965 [Chthoniobacterales bacterium]|nr:hypothetical protein [Chthoniobacterales bacterium]
MKFSGFDATRIVIGALLVLAVSAPAKGETTIGKNTVVRFLSANESRPVIAARDDFVKRLSPFDRAARLKVAQPVSEEQYLAFVGSNVRDWTEKETEQLCTIMAEFPPLLAGLPWPATIQLIKTTGAEEGNAAYTRGAAIFLPVADLARSSPELKRLLCHELFHILSRRNPGLREKLYSVIGFTACDEVELPPELAARKITNPDAPRNDHLIRLQIDGQTRLALPVLLSSAETYDVKRGGEFFNYLTFQFLVMEPTTTPRRFKVAQQNGSPRLVGIKAVTGFFEQVGRNTEYIIHPEEILADNFALLVLGGEKIATPEILDKMKKVLFAK